MCSDLRTHRTLMEPEKQSQAGPSSALEAGLPFTVVGIGASAGGYAALMTLLQNMPPSPGIALVVILHLAADEPSAADKVLQRGTGMADFVLAASAIPAKLAELRDLANAIRSRALHGQALDGIPLDLGPWPEHTLGEVLDEFHEPPSDTADVADVAAAHARSKSMPSSGYPTQKAAGAGPGSVPNRCSTSTAACASGSA
jgi:hypothetical protein